MKTVALDRLEGKEETWRATYGSEQRDFTGADNKSAMAVAMEWLEKMKRLDHERKFGVSG